jgi:zinc transport system ATP-binding protein
VGEPIPPAADEPVIRIRDLAFTYDGPPVLEGVNLDVPRGDFASIIGPNGGGKTTLLKLILGLLAPQTGSVRVLGRSPIEARRRIGYMPQHVQLDASFPVTAGDVVLTGRLARRFPAGPFRRDDREAAARALEDVGVTDLRNRPFFALSGGQRQRVLIARALVGRPELLLLDEPTASLDPRVQDDLYELLRKLNETMTVILVSHDVATVSQHVRNVVCVNRQVETHPSSAIHGELERLLFHGAAGARFVHHDAHADGSAHEPGHTHGH